MHTEDIRTVVIAGAGTMGHSIAQVFATGGYSVVLTDSSEDALRRAEKTIKSNLETLAEYGEQNSDIDEIMNNMVFTIDSENAFSQGDFLLEAVYEEAEVKREVFRQMDRWAPPHAILASNTSFLNIFEIVETERPGRVLIAHWYAPAHIMPLVEVVRGPDTEDECCEVVMELLRKVGKRPVFIPVFIEGFIVNRFQAAIRGVIEEFLSAGICSPEEIDLAVRAGLAVRMPVLGVLQKLDFVGLDLVERIQKNKGVECPFISEKVRRGDLGIKSGKGIYDYSSKTPEEVLRLRDRYCLEVIALMDRLDLWKGID